MIDRDGFPICPDKAEIDISWNSAVNGEIEFMGARITFKNINMTTAGKIYKEQTSLQFNPLDPLPWVDGIPAEVIAVWASPEDALRDIIGMLYESDEHQYRLETKIRPEPEA